MALAVAAPLAACGGDDESGASKEDYRKEAQTIVDKLQTDVGSAQQNLNSREEQAVTTGIDQFRSSLTEAKTQLDELEPPVDFKQVHDKLIGELGTLEGDVQAVSDAIEA